MTDERSLQPWLLAELATIAGEGHALAFAAEFGGRAIYVPAVIPADHPIARVLGRRGADHLARLRGGEMVTVPNGPAGTVAQARRRMVKALADGQSANEAARAAGMHQRTAFRMKAKIRGGDGGQGSLF